MRFFRRKTLLDDDALRCPNCEERVPDGALACAMCGRDLRDVLAADASRDRDEVNAPHS